MTKMTFSPPVRKVSTSWRASCCALLRILRAVRSREVFLHEEELCKVALTCHFSLGCDLSLLGLSGSLSLRVELVAWRRNVNGELY